jgi:hypothetical protein
LAFDDNFWDLPIGGNFSFVCSGIFVISLLSWASCVSDFSFVVLEGVDSGFITDEGALDRAVRGEERKTDGLLRFVLNFSLLLSCFFAFFLFMVAYQKRKYKMWYNSILQLMQIGGNAAEL